VEMMLMFLLHKMKLSYLLCLVTRTMFSIMEKATLTLWHRNYFFFYFSTLCI